MWMIKRNKNGAKQHRSRKSLQSSVLDRFKSFTCGERNKREQIRVDEKHAFSTIFVLYLNKNDRNSVHVDGVPIRVEVCQEKRGQN